MPEGRLQRAREQYAELNENPALEHARIHRGYSAQWCRVCGEHKSTHAPECDNKADSLPVRPWPLN